MAEYPFLTLTGAVGSGSGAFEGDRTHPDGRRSKVYVFLGGTVTLGVSPSWSRTP